MARGERWLVGGSWMVGLCGSEHRQSEILVAVGALEGLVSPRPPSDIEPTSTQTPQNLRQVLVKGEEDPWIDNTVQ